MWLVLVAAPASAHDYRDHSSANLPANFIFGYGSLINTASRNRGERSNPGYRLHSAPSRFRLARGTDGCPFIRLRARLGRPCDRREAR